MSTCLDVEFAVGEVEFMDVVTHLLHRLLYYLLAYDQLPEIYHVLQLLDHLLKPHHLQILIKLHILDHQSKTNRLTRPQHQMPNQIQNFR
jgi:hypothetical protein